MECAKKLVVIVFALLAAGCVTRRPAVAPMPAEVLLEPAGDKRTLVIFLPGMRDMPRTFVEKGFVEEVARRKLEVGVVAVDSHFGYFQEKSIVTRLRTDIIQPARARGYRNFWLVGISLGGWGALQYLKAYPDEVSGTVLLAPFVGTRDMQEEVERAGGLERWQASDSKLTVEQRDWIAWLRDTFAGESDPKVFLGYGVKDGFADGLAKFAHYLPPENVATAKGGHDWPPWRELWSEFLDRGAAR